jgi:hypothetical protein
VRVGGEWPLEDPADATHDDRCDPEFMLSAVRFNGLWLQHASTELRCDGELVAAAVLQNPGAARFAQGNDAITAAVECNPTALQYIEPEDCGVYFELARAAVEQDGLALRFVSEAGRADKGLVSAAVENNPHALTYASDALKSDPNAVSGDDVLHLVLELDLCKMKPGRGLLAHAGFMASALEYLINTKAEYEGLDMLEGDALRALLANIPASLFSDSEFALSCITTFDMDLQDVPEPQLTQLLADEDFVLRGFERGTLIHAEDVSPLLADRDFVLRAVQYMEDNGGRLWSSQIMGQVVDPLKHDRSLVLEVLRLNGDALCCCLLEWRGDRELVLAAITSRGVPHDCLLKYASAELRADQVIVLAALEAASSVPLHRCTSKIDSAASETFAHASTALRADRACVLAAVKLNGRALRYAPKFRADGGVVLLAAAQAPDALCYAACYSARGSSMFDVLRLEHVLSHVPETSLDGFRTRMLQLLEQLITRDSFMLFLLGTTHRTRSQTPKLPKIKRHETHRADIPSEAPGDIAVVDIMQLIAEYAGVIVDGNRTPGDLPAIARAALAELEKEACASLFSLAHLRRLPTLEEGPVSSDPPFFNYDTQQ